MRKIVEMSDFLGDDTAHPRQFVLRQVVENFECYVLQPALRFGIQIRRKTRNLAGQGNAHVVIDILDQQGVGLPRRRLILSHRTAHAGFLVLGKIIKYLGLQIGALGEIKPHRTIHALAESGSHGFWRLFAGARRRFTQ